MRQAPTFIKNKKIEKEKLLPTVHQKRLNYGVKETSSALRLRSISLKVTHFLPQSRRNTLHEKNASKRKRVTPAAPAFVIPAKSFQVTRLLKKRARKFGLKKRIAHRQGTKKN